MEQEIMEADLEQLRYPVGRFSYEYELSLAEAQEKIAEIDALPARLHKAVESLTGEQLHTPYRPEGWTVRQVIHHIADSHMNGYIRFRLALTEDEPTIKPYDEKAWAELPDARTGPVLPSLLLIEALHTRWAEIMRTLGHDDLMRTYMHPESGRMTLYRSIANYAWHGRHHLAHITSIRDRSDWNTGVAI